jgi:hypothetical protein
MIDAARHVYICENLVGPLSRRGHMDESIPAEDDFAQESLHISCYGKRAAPRNAQFKIDRDVELIET